MARRRQGPRTPKSSLPRSDRSALVQLTFGNCSFGPTFGLSPGHVRRCQSYASFASRSRAWACSNPSNAACLHAPFSPDLYHATHQDSIAKSALNVRYVYACSNADKATEAIRFYFLVLESYPFFVFEVSTPAAFRPILVLRGQGGQNCNFGIPGALAGAFPCPGALRLKIPRREPEFPWSINHLRRMPGWAF